MNVEERLRDTLATQADTVAFDPYAYDAIMRRRARRRLTRWVAPVSAVAATVAVLGLVAVVVRPAGTRPAPPAGGNGVSRRVLFLRGYGAAPMLVDPNNLDGAPIRRFDIELVSIAATGDGRTFYGLAHDGPPDYRCNSTLYRLDDSGRTEAVARIAGYADSLAVTRDGSKAAYTVLPQKGNGNCEADKLAKPDVQVRDLTTGASRTWTWHPRAGQNNGTGPNALSWARDGRHLGFGTMAVVNVLDTSAPGSTIGPPQVATPSGMFLAGIDGPGSACTAVAPAYLPTGEFVAEVQCIHGGHWDAGRVAVLDPATLRIGRTLFASPDGHSVKWLAFDRTGRRAFVGVEPGNGRSSGSGSLLYRWDGAGAPQPVEQSRERAWHVAW